MSYSQGKYYVLQFIVVSLFLYVNKQCVLRMGIGGIVCKFVMKLVLNFIRHDIKKVLKSLHRQNIDSLQSLKKNPLKVLVIAM